MVQKKIGSPKTDPAFIIPIDMSGKQILVIEGSRMDDLERETLMKSIQAWMNSAMPMTVLMIPNGVSVKLVKINRRKNDTKASD